MTSKIRNQLVMNYDIQGVPLMTRPPAVATQISSCGYRTGYELIHNLEQIRRAIQSLIRAQHIIEKVLDEGISDEERADLLRQAKQGKPTEAGYGNE